MLASLRERLESGPVPSAFRFAGRGRGCPPHLSTSPTFSGTAAGTATEHRAAATAAAAGAVPAAAYAYGACASYSGYASHAGGDKRDRYVLENMDLLDDADEKKGAAVSASRKDNDDGKMKTGAIYGNQSIDQSVAEALMGIGGRPALQVMRVSGLDAALTPSSGPSDSTEEEQEEASPAESKKTHRHRCEELDIDEDYLGKIDVMTEEVSSVVQKILAAAASVAPPTPPLTPASAMSSPADSFHGSTRAVFFGSGYNEKDSGVIFESVNEDSPLLPQVVPRSPGVVDIPPPRFPSPRVYLTADGLNMDLCILDGVNSDGGFGDVVFVKDKTTQESFAFKKSKDTPSGRRQMEREVAALSDVRGKVSHVVHVQEISSTSGAPMLLMRREPGTLSSMLCNCSNTDPRALVRVLCGVLTAVGGLHDMQYVHRDIKPGNILVDGLGDARLTDFGMCLKMDEARLRENIGDGTPCYSAPETSDPRGGGATVVSEIYAVSVVLVEGMLNKCAFGEEELLEAAEDRLQVLEVAREDLLEKIEDEIQDDEDEAELEEVRIKEHYLGVVAEDGWVPNEEARAKLNQLGQPLSFFMAQSDERGDDTLSFEEKGTEARREAQAHPRRLFEDNWVEWLTTSSRAASDEGLRQVIAFVLDRGMIDPRPEARPQTVKAAKELLRQALAVYEVASALEEGTEQDDA
ncbi:unnamed protein product [Ectocarpus sp. 6 AP-2014]